MGPIIAICLYDLLNLKETVIFFNYLFSRDGVGSETVFMFITEDANRLTIVLIIKCNHFLYN
jgi:hypothetical protein